MYSSKSFLKIVCIVSLFHFYGHCFAQSYRLVKESPDDYHSVIFGNNRKYIASGSIEFRPGYTFEGKASKTMDAYIDNSNDFRIGMFTTYFDKTKSLLCNKDVPYDSPFDASGNYTSSLNVLSQDGFNTYNSYFPHPWQSQIELENILKISQNLKIKAELDARGFFRPDVVDNYTTGTGVNVYDCCGKIPPFCLDYAFYGMLRVNHNYLFQNLYTKPEFRDAIWGYHVSEEMSHAHQTFLPIDCIGAGNSNDGYQRKDCSGYKLVGKENYVLSEVPPNKVIEAMNHFKNASNSTDHKVVMMEVQHGGAIYDNIDDKEYAKVGDNECSPPYQNNKPVDYNPQEYVTILSKNDGRMVFLEGSYNTHDNGVNCGTNSKTSYDDIKKGGVHYLSKFISIDYALKYANQVHSAFFLPVRKPTQDNNAETYEDCYLDYWHSNGLIRNANWLWFQTYTSVIHGATGIWFWEFGTMYEPFQANQNPEKHLRNNHFKREYFPEYYKEYIGPLANELRYLINNNFLSTNPASVLATKTDFSDPQKIVESVKNYINNSYKEERSENYGLRYTIRTNGNEVIMIVTNPFHGAVNVEFNFFNSSIDKVRSATGIELLFENVNSEQIHTYKVNRKGKVDLTNNWVKEKTVFKFSNNKKKVRIFFAPLDTHIIKFTY